MKEIELKKTPITNSSAPEGFMLDYKAEFLRIVEVIPEGITASQMGVAIKIAEALKATPAGEALILEDAEADYLANRLRLYKFQFVAPELVAMVEAVTEAKIVTTPHLKSEKAASK